MVNMQQAASQLMDIAKSTYGSGIFEGSKGGNGYVGQYTDADGVAHTVKVLTHRNERKDFANAATRGDTEHLAAATKQLKASLIAIANGTNVDLGNRIKALLDNAQQQAVQEKMTVGKEGGEQVGLLSRKIVAQAITTIANEGKIADFSWDDVAKNRARTEDDTTVETVNGELTAKRREAEDVKAYGVLDPMEKQFGNWSISLPKPGDKDAILGDSPSEIASLVRMRCRAMRSGVGDTCAKFRQLLAIKIFRQAGDDEEVYNALDEKLARLENEKLNARQLLEKLHDELDIKKYMRGILVMRLALETCALEEENENENDKLTAEKLRRMLPKEDDVTACTDLEQLEKISRCFFAQKKGGEAVLSISALCDGNPIYKEVGGAKSMIEIRSKVMTKLFDLVLEEFHTRELKYIPVKPDVLTFAEYVEAVRREYRV